MSCSTAIACVSRPQKKNLMLSHIEGFVHEHVLVKHFSLRFDGCMIDREDSRLDVDFRESVERYVLVKTGLRVGLAFKEHPQRTVLVYVFRTTYVHFETELTLRQLRGLGQSWAEICDHQWFAEWRGESCFTPSSEGAAFSTSRRCPPPTRSRICRPSKCS